MSCDAPTWIVLSSRRCKLSTPLAGVHSNGGATVNRRKDAIRIRTAITSGAWRFFAAIIEQNIPFKMDRDVPKKIWRFVRPLCAIHIELPRHRPAIGTNQRLFRSHIEYLQV